MLACDQRHLGGKSLGGFSLANRWNSLNFIPAKLSRYMVFKIAISLNIRRSVCRNQVLSNQVTHEYKITSISYNSQIAAWNEAYNAYQPIEQSYQSI